MKKFTLYLSALMLVASVLELQAQVCTFAGQECCGEGITNFQLNGTPAINRTSTVNENAGFTNTGVTAAVAAGQTYNFSVTFPLEGNIVNCNTYNFKIYIDYNHNNLLTDVGEEAASLADVPNGTHTGSFTVPSSALSGNTYMRVMMKMAATSLTGGFCGHTAITPCNVPADGIGFHGEVENYTLNITSTAGIPSYADGPQFFISPFPVNDMVNVYFSLRETSGVSFAVYNMLGRRVYATGTSSMAAGAHATTIGLIEMNITEKGIYFFEMSAGGKKMVQRLVIL